MQATFLELLASVLIFVFGWLIIFRVVFQAFNSKDSVYKSAESSQIPRPSIKISTKSSYTQAPYPPVYPGFNSSQPFGGECGSFKELRT